MGNYTAKDAGVTVNHVPSGWGGAVPPFPTKTCKNGHDLTLENSLRGSRCRICDNEKSARYRKKSDKYKTRRKLRIYGLHDDISTQGFCDICGTTEITNRGFCIDHDHKTGTVRGVLCHRCNSMLGHARDNVQTLLNAVGYLQRTCRPNG